jgi:hypothetical protein
MTFRAAALIVVRVVAASSSRSASSSAFVQNSRLMAPSVAHNLYVVASVGGMPNGGGRPLPDRPRSAPRPRALTLLSTGRLSAAEQAPEHWLMRREAPDPYPDRETGETEDQGAVRHPAT